MAELRPVLTPERQRNQALNIKEYEQRSETLESTPLALFIELTQNCNLSCSMCRSAEKYDPSWNMNDETFGRLLGPLLETTHVVDVRGFGESTMLKDFPERVSQLLTTGVQLRLVTNGQINRPGAWDEMMACSSLIAISCDGAQEETFSKLRQGGSLKRLTTTVAEMVRFRDLHGAPAENIALTVAVSRPNLGELVQLVQLADSLSVRKIVLFPIQIEEDHEWHLRGDLAGTAAALEQAQREADRLDVTIQLGAALDTALAITDKVKAACMHPWSFGYINYKGNVGFCDHLIGDPTYTFESLADKDFTEIWNGEHFRRLRRAHAHLDIPDEFSPCRWCFKQRYVDFEHLLHPSYLQNVVSNRSVVNLFERRDPQSLPVIPFA